MNYSIGQVSKKLGLSIHTLRFYEKEGLIPYLKRTKSGYRQFDDRSIEALRTIECLKETGMPLKEIKEFQEWCEVGDSTITKRKELFKERRDVVLEEINKLKEVLDLIDFKTWFYEKAEELGSEQDVIELGFENIPKEIQELYIKTHKEQIKEYQEKGLVY